MKAQIGYLEQPKTINRQINKYQVNSYIRPITSFVRRLFGKETGQILMMSIPLDEYDIMYIVFLYIEKSLSLSFPPNPSTFTSLVSFKFMTPFYVIVTT